MKALEKDRSRRYETANGFAMDIQRYLGDEAVLACPPSATYRLRKLVWRHRHSVFVSTIVALGLIGFLATFALRESLNANTLRAAMKEVETAGELKDAANKNLELEKQALAQERRKARIDLSNRLLDTGLESCERHEVDVGLLWLARSLEAAPDDAMELQRVIRSNMAEWREKAALLKGAFATAGPVQHMLIRPDGRTLLTVSEISDGLFGRIPGAEVRLWDTQTGKPISTPISSRDYYSYLVAISPDGSLVLAGRDPRTAQLWEVDGMRPRGSPLTHRSEIQGTAISADGSTILTRTSTSIHLWDAKTAKPIGPPIDDPLGYGVAVLSPDGKTLFTAGGRGSKPGQLWDVATGKPRDPPFPCDGNCQVAAFSPDGRHIVTAGNRARPDSAARGITVVVNDGSRGPSGRLQFWETSTGKPVGQIFDPQLPPDAVQFSPDGNQLLVRSSSAATELWCSPWANMTYGFTWFRGRALGEKPLIVDMTFSPDRQMILTGGADKTARLWSAAGGQPLSVPLNHPRFVNSVGFSRDGQTLITGCSDGVVRLWEAPPPSRRTEAWTTPIEPDLNVGYSTFGPGAETFLRVVSLGGDSETIATLTDLATRRLITPPLSIDAAFQSAAVSANGRKVVLSAAQWERSPVRPDGSRLAKGSKQPTLWLCDGRSWKQTGPVRPLEGPITALAFGPGDTSVLIGGPGGAARLWDITRWAPLGPPMIHHAAGDVAATDHSAERQGRMVFSESAVAAGAIRVVALSPDGRLALTGGSKTVRLWNTSTGSPLGQPLVHQGDVLAAAFSHDGRTIATGGEDRTARLWDVATQRQISLPMHHPEPVSAIVFSPDGQSVLTSTGRAGARVWDVATGKRLGPALPAGNVIAYARTDSSILLARAGFVSRWQRPAPLGGAPDRLARWSEVVSGHYLDAADVVGWLPIERWQEQHRQVHEHVGPPVPALDEATLQREYARYCVDSHWWPAALWYLDKLIIAEPNDWQHYLQRARVYGAPDLFGVVGLGKWQEAAADLSKAIGLGASGFEVWQLRGRAFERLEEWNKAAADFAKAGELGADSQVWSLCALAYVKAGMPNEYRRTCEQLLARFGQTDDANVADRVAWACLAAAKPGVDPARVVPLAEQVLAAARPRKYAGRSKLSGYIPDRAEALQILGLALYRAGRFDAACQRLNDAFEAMPPNEQNHEPCWHLLLAMAHQRAGRADGAKTNLERVRGRLTQGASLEPCLFLREEAERLFGIRLDAESLPARQQPVDAGPGWQYLAARAWAYIQLQQPERALADCTRAIELGGQGHQLWHARGVAHAMLRHWDDAIAAMRRAIQSNPDDFELHLVLGAFLMDKGGARAEAVAECREAFRLMPNFPRVRDQYTRDLNELAWDLATNPDGGRRDPGRAVTEAKRAIDLVPENGTFWNTLGVAHYRAGEWKPAIAALQRSVLLRKGGDSFDWFFLAMAHWKLGEHANSRRWHAQAIEWMDKNQPKNDQLRLFRSEAAQLLGQKPESENKKRQEKIPPK
jgi:WD40 repeat protein/tetratricopeptide (TPR) repeat protein